MKNKGLILGLGILGGLYLLNKTQQQTAQTFVNQTMTGFPDITLSSGFQQKLSTLSLTEQQEVASFMPQISDTTIILAPTTNPVTISPTATAGNEDIYTGWLSNLSIETQQQYASVPFQLIWELAGMPDMSKGIQYFYNPSLGAYGGDYPEKNTWASWSDFFNLNLNPQLAQAIGTSASIADSALYPYFH